MKFYGFWSGVVEFFTRKAQEGSEEVLERYDVEEWPELERECYVFRYETPAQRKGRKLAKSKGHILFSGRYEYFRRDGHICKAIKFDPVQIDGYRRQQKEEEY